MASRTNTADVGYAGPIAVAGLLFGWFIVFLIAGYENNVQRVMTVITGATSAALAGVSYTAWRAARSK